MQSSMDFKSLFRIQSNTLHPKQGNLLLSEPTMNDYFFGRSVILLIDHNEEEGSFGIIMNKSMKVRVSELVDLFQDFDAPVYLGGPVAKNQIFFMHTLGELIPESYKIMDGLYWGGDADSLNTLLSTGIANRNNVRFFLGYSGWDAGQLRQELERNSWLVSHTNSSTLLGTSPTAMWKSYVSRMGAKYQIWNQFPENPEDN